VDLDAFFVEVERVLDPSLRGKPVVVGGDPGRRGVVAAASYEARAYGIHSAMPSAEARRLCPHLVILRGHGEYYRRASDAVGRVLEQYTPFLEWTSIDEAYLDLTGTERLFGPPLQVAEEIRQRVEEELRLSVSVGLASSKLVAKIASTRAKPRGVLWILPGRERAFLAPLEVTALPGIGPKVAERLRFLGVRTLGDLTHTDGKALEAIFGVLGPWLVRRAAGVDSSPVARDTDRKSVGRETTFAEDSNDRAFLDEILFRLTCEVGSRLRGKGLRGRTITVKVRYSDFVTTTRSLTVASPTDLDHEIFETARELLGAALGRRLRVRLLGVTVSSLESPPLQLTFFDDPARLRRESVYRQVDAIRRRYGYESVGAARALLEAEERR
jgi:DNA polymerase-4